MLRYRPGFIVAGLTSYCTANASVVSPNAYPVWKALTFASAISGRLANFERRNAIVPSVGRPKSHDISPSANMFFARSASRCVTPSTSLVAASVMLVSGTVWTSYASRLPSSSGFAS